MSIFTDTFNRANGALGGNWTASNANVAIVNNWVSCSTIAQWWAWDSTITASSTRSSATARINARYAAIAGNGPAIKINTSTGYGYTAYIHYATGTYYLRIGKGNLLSNYNTASYTLPYAPPGVFDLTITYDNGTITASIPGLGSVQLQDTDYVSNTAFGMRGSYNTDLVDSVTFVDGAEPTLTVSPSPIGNYGSTTALTFTGTGTAWNSTSPTFTVVNGTLSSQSIASDTSATATYDPANFLGTTTFTDPSTGATDDVLVTSNPDVFPPAGGLSAEVVAYLERSAAAEEDATILNREMTVGSGGDTASAEVAIGDIRLAAYKSSWTIAGDPSTAALLYTLWRLVNGQYDPPAGPYPEPTFTSVDAGLGLVKGDLDALMGEAEWTLPDVIGYLGGDPIASNRDIMTAIAALDFDDTAILDAIAAAQGDPLATIKAAIDLIYELQTVNGYTLSSVKTWVESVQGSGLPTVKDVADRLALIQPTTTNSIDDILTKTVGQTTLQSIVDLAVLALAGTEGATIAAVLDGIGDLAELLGGLTVSVKAPPVWPGIDGVTLGTPVALASQLTIEEPMDGCIVDVTGVDGGVAFYTYGGVKAYRNVGALCFLTDQGDLEDWQLLGREHAIYTPKSMIQAGGLKLFTGHGLVGTVTPWTVNTE